MTAGSAAVMPQATVAGRPQPQTTNEAAGGPFIRHAPSGRRPIYNQTATFGLFFGPPMVSSPGWNTGFRLKFNVATGGSGGSTLNADAPWNLVQLLQLKDAWGTNLLAGPGYEMLFLVPMFAGQFGWGLTRDPRTLPTWAGITAASAAQTWATQLPFEFTKGYGVISGANAALLPVLQLTLTTLAAGPYSGGTAPSSSPPTTGTAQLDSDYYWLPNVPVDPPGIGTTCQYIFQPCNPVIASAGSLRVQLPRLGGYLTNLILELRDSTNARVDAWPTRPGIYVDGVELIDSDINTIYDDMAIQTGIGATTGPTQTGAGTANMPRPTGVIQLNRKVSLAQFDLGKLDTGEVFLSTNPGTQIEIAGVPWGTISNSPGTLNAVIGQVVPSGPLVQGLPQV